jgi:hypothetical protein
MAVVFSVTRSASSEPLRHNIIIIIITGNSLYI